MFAAFAAKSFITNEVFLMTKLADDLALGMAEVADELGVPVNQAYYLVKKGVVPTFRMGKKHAARRSVLRTLGLPKNNDAA